MLSLSHVGDRRLGWTVAYAPASGYTRGDVALRGSHRAETLGAPARLDIVSGSTLERSAGDDLASVVSVAILGARAGAT